MEGAVALPTGASRGAGSIRPRRKLGLAQDSLQVLIGSWKFLKLCEAAVA